MICRFKGTPGQILTGGLPLKAPPHLGLLPFLPFPDETQESPLQFLLAP